MLSLVILVFILASAQLVPFHGEPDKIFDRVIDTFNEIFVRPVSMPNVVSSVNVTALNVTVGLRGAGVVVDGDFLRRVAPSSRYSENDTFVYKTAITLGGLTFTYNHVNVTVNGVPHDAEIGFSSYQYPVPFILEKRPDAKYCYVSSGPFNTDNFGATIRIKENTQDPTLKALIKELQKSGKFVEPFFLGAYFPAIQDPIYLLIKQYKFCDYLVGVPDN